MNDPLRHVSADDPIVRAVFRAARVFSRYFRASLFGAELIPPDEGVMLVGNHALMGIDTWALVPELVRQTKRVPRGMALRSLFDLPVIGTSLRRIGMVRGERASAVELLKRREMVLTYPGGARDSLKGRSERYKLQWDGRYGFAAAALRAQRPIQPVVGVGPDDCFPILNDTGLIPTTGLGSASLKLPLFLPVARRIPFDFHIGKPIAPPEIDADAVDPPVWKEAVADFASDTRRATQSLLDLKVEERFGSHKRRGLFKLAT